MGSNVNTPFFQVPMPEFGHGVRVRVQGLDMDSRSSLFTIHGLDLVLGHWTGLQSVLGFFAFLILLPATIGSKDNLQKTKIDVNTLHLF